MNKCNLVKDLLPLYVDGALSEDSRALVERHLKGCPSCAEEAEKLKAPVPEERALAALKADEQQTNDRKQAASIRRVSRKFKIRAAVVGAVSALLCCVIVFCCYFIPAEYARKERLLEFNGWREYEGIRRSTKISFYALSGYNEDYYKHYDNTWTEQKTAVPYLHEEDNAGIQIKFRHSEALLVEEINPFTFSVSRKHDSEAELEAKGTITFTTNTTDVSEIVTSYGTPALYEYVQEHPELYDPLEFAYFCFNYDFESVTPWSSESKILLTNDMRKTLGIWSIWGSSDPYDGRYDDEGFPRYASREIIPFELETYRGYVLRENAGDLIHIILSYGGYLWDIRFDHAPGAALISVSSPAFSYFIDNLEFVGIG